MSRKSFVFGAIILMLMIALATMPDQSGASVNPGQLVGQLETDLASAKSNQVDVLSPKLFKEAQSALIKAKKALEKGAKLSAISQYVADGNANLKKAQEIAQVSRTVLRDTNEARNKALKVDADKLGKPFEKVENEYLKLTTAIERDNLSYAQEYAAEVQAAFRDVEIMAIKNSAIGNARIMLADADEAKVQKLVPMAYSDALQALNEADAYIGQNPYATEAISQKAAHAEFMARRMMAIRESSQKFKQMTPEASAIYVESLFGRLGQTMNTGDLRDKGVEDQFSALAGTFQIMGQTSHSLEKEKQRHQTRLASLEQQLSGLKGYSSEQEAARQKLAAERAFNEKFNKVQHFFRPDEAEVYKQGNQLVIRMRGIQFPVGQAILSSDNYTLLSKVQQAIQTFGQPTVTIEGHTDSTGSAQTNQELSQKRAEAVKTYLVANKTLPINRIRAAGFGPDRPLAPNSTPEGRAINRRIDVLVTPAKTQ